MSESIRICHVLHSLTLGDGVTEVVWNLARHLDSERFKLGVVCLARRGDRAEEFEAFGVPVHLVGAVSSTSPGVALHNLRAVRRLAGILNLEKPDVVHVHEFFPGTLGRLGALGGRGTKVVLTLHNRDEWKRAPHVLVDRALAKRTDRVVANSEAVRGFVLKQEGFAPEKVCVIYNGIEADRFKHACRDGQPGYVVGSVGRMAEQKGYGYLLDAADLLKKAQLLGGLRFVIVGGDAHPSESVKLELEEKVKALGLEDVVEFLGERKDVPEVLTGFDCFVLPSLWEGFGLAIAEAMAASLPVVASRVDGIVEVVEDGVTGILVPPKDSKALAEAIRWMVDHPAEAKAMGRKGRERVERLFSAQRMADEHMSLYESLLSG
jgi:glycosyltransferase involved in cell wall biosynthesis